MSNLTSNFNECCKQPDDESLLQIRANYFTDIVMNERESTSAGGINIPQAGIANGVTERKKREKNAKDIAFAVKLMNDRLAQIEANLVDKYGEDFAENLAAEYLDEDTYKELMSIEDKEERRHAIANALNEGIGNGTIDPDAINENPDFKEWLDLRKEKDHMIQLEQSSENLELDTTISSENNVEETFGITEGNEEDAFNSIFANKSSITI